MLQQYSGDDPRRDLAEGETDIDQRDRSGTQPFGKIFAGQRHRTRHRAADADSGEEAEGNQYRYFRRGYGEERHRTEGGRARNDHPLMAEAGGEWRQEKIAQQQPNHVGAQDRTQRAVRDMPHPGDLRRDVADR